MANLLYGTGMRLMECVRLRVKDVDFERGEILIRDGKGGKDRVTMLPQSLAGLLQAHLLGHKDIQTTMYTCSQQRRKGCCKPLGPVITLFPPITRSAKPSAGRVL
jgi:hypothetical protein